MLAAQFEKSLRRLESTLSYRISVVLEETEALSIAVVNWWPGAGAGYSGCALESVPAPVKLFSFNRFTGPLIMKQSLLQVVLIVGLMYGI